MDFSNLLIGGAAFGFIASCWVYIKTVLWKICNLFVQQIEIHDEATSNAVIGHLIKNYRKSKMYDKVYAGNGEYIRNSDRNGLVAYEVFGKHSMIFWNWCFPFIFQGPEKKNQSATNNGVEKKEVHGYITYIRGTLNVDKIISNAIYERNDMVWNAESEQKSRHRRFFIKYVPDINKDQNQYIQGTVSWWFHQSHIRLLGYKCDQLGRGKNDGVSLLDNLIFPKRIKTLIEEIKLWRNNRHWYQERGIPWKRGWLLYGPPGTGKCLGKDTPILMYDGTIKMVQQVEVGDLLMGPDSTPRKVLSLARGRENMYRVVPKKGDSYVVNESHILSLKMSGDASGHKKRSIVNISVHDYLQSSANFRHYAKGWRTGVLFQEQDVPLDPYLLGVWLGDGHLHKPSIKVPQCYKLNTRDVRLEVLAGIIDTDGHLNCGGYELKIKSKTLANDVAFLARSLGFAAYVKPCQKKCDNNGDYFRISISGPVAIIPVRVGYKKADVRHQAKNVLVTSIQIEALGEDDYYGFELDGDRLFMLGDFTVTHNTGLARAFAEDLDLPIFVFNLSEIGNFEFMRNWIGMQQSTPCIALIEDIDNVFHGRENVSSNRGLLSSIIAMKRENGKKESDNKEELSGGRLNFDVFLNCLDGVERSEGVFTIITTNDLNKIDPALGQPRKLENGTIEFISTRPGRIDKAIELTYMEPAEKRIMAKRILGDYPDALEKIMTYIDGNTEETKETPAQFQERCAQIALVLFWREQHPELFAHESGAYILVDNEAAQEVEKKKKELV